MAHFIMRYDLPVVKFEHILPFVVNWAQLQGEFKEGKLQELIKPSDLFLGQSILI